MDAAGVDSIDFLRRKKPNITVDHSRLEIFSIFKPLEGDESLMLACVSYSPYGLVDVEINANSRKSTWGMIERIVENEVSR